MWSRFQTDSTWGECKWPFWPFHLSDREISVSSGSVSKKIIIKHFPKQVCGASLRRYQTLVFTKHFIFTLLFSVVSKSHRVFRRANFLLKSKSRHLRPSVRLRVQVPLALLTRFPPADWRCERRKERRGFGSFQEEAETPLKGHKAAVLTWLHHSRGEQREGGETLWDIIDKGAEIIDFWWLVGANTCQLWCLYSL